MEFQIDKSKWKRVSLGDVLTKREENDKENAFKRFDRFLKVEHMDAESLHVKRWASQEKGDEINPTFYKIFRKGQILFPTRNPHLRRTALASFDGICGEKTLTLEPNEDFLIPTFIPFLFHSESFYNHTIGAIVGSTNPHVRWRDVANYEFLLPPKDQQAQLAELLWAMDEVIEREKENLRSIFTYKNSVQKFLYSKEYSKKVRLLKYAKVLGGFAFSSSDFKNVGTPVIKIKNIINGEIVIDSTENCIDLLKISKIERYELSPGDILIAMTGATLGKMGIIQEEITNSYLNQRVGKFEFSDDVDKHCLYGILDSEYFLLELKKYIGEGAQGNISSDDIAKCLVPEMTESQMVKFGNVFKNIYKSSRTIESKIKSSQSLQKSLINQVF